MSNTKKEEKEMKSELTLPVTKAAFLLLSDPNHETRKNEEYRAISKYWTNRFLTNFFVKGRQVLFPYEGCVFGPDHLKTFETVKFTNGYGHKVPAVVREWKGLDIGLQNPLWVPEGFLDLNQNFFRIKLGEIIK